MNGLFRAASRMGMALRGGTGVCVAIVSMALSQCVWAVTTEELIQKYDAAQAGIVEVLYPFRLGKLNDAAETLEAVGELMTEIQADLQDPDLIAALGKSHRTITSKTAAAVKLLTQLTAWVTPPEGAKAKPVNSVISKLMATGKSVKSVQEAASKVVLKDGDPNGLDEIMIVTEPFARKDFWDKPNQIVKYKLYPPGWPAVTTFDPPPTITIHNTFGTVVDPDYVQWDPVKNILTLRMGPNEGVARFEVTYQGKTKKHLMSCRGPSGSTSLPYGISGLQKGNYLITMSGSVTAWAPNPQTGQLMYHTENIPDGSFPTRTVLLKTPKTFLNNAIKEANVIAADILAQSGSKGVASLVSVDDCGFVIAITVETGTPTLGARGTFYITTTKI
ncbi:MAG: hypothetical protein KBA18_11435 [Kiritimatiellae bacterium]|nr:hypothetical protein [Kiritimatiellia bacterium]